MCKLLCEGQCERCDKDGVVWRKKMMHIRTLTLSGGERLSERKKTPTVHSH